jgi:atypical dual specificity phosphatase
VIVPPTYPRIPHLVSGRGSRDDEILDDAGATSLLSRLCVVEEKVDGANVVIWAETGAVRCALRSGVGGSDRAGQLGPLRAWLGRKGFSVSELVIGGPVVYAEWMWFTHTVPYDRLPSLLIGLDMWTPDGGFLLPEARSRMFTDAGIPVPPELLRGKPRSIKRLESLMGQSTWGPGPMEGVVVRALDGAEPRAAKLLRPGWRAIGDDDWARGRPRNHVAVGEQSWR